MKKSSNRVGGIVFMLIGACFAAFSWYLYKGDRAFMKQSAPATGIVIRSEYVRSERSGGAYYAIIAFQLAGGKKQEFRSEPGTGRPIYKDGEQVEIRYEKQTPANAKITGFWELWGLTAILGGFGLLFIGAGLLIMRT